MKYTITIDCDGVELEGGKPLDPRCLIEGSGKIPEGIAAAIDDLLCRIGEQHERWNHAAYQIEQLEKAIAELQEAGAAGEPARVHSLQRELRRMEVNVTALRQALSQHLTEGRGDRIYKAIAMPPGAENAEGPAEPSTSEPSTADPWYTAALERLRTDLAAMLDAEHRNRNAIDTQTKNQIKDLYLQCGDLLAKQIKLRAELEALRDSVRKAAPHGAE